MLHSKLDAYVPASVRAKVKRRLFYRKSREIFHSFNHYFHELSRLRSPRDLADWIYYKSSTKFPLRSYPPVVNMELTNVCNLSCRHCHRPVLNVGRTQGYMSLGILKKIVEESQSTRAPI